ncbi:AI-2E family transporter [Poriferisphaera sp. WC338]|uniref:AI-2E family transporter n=1 Tax=Poriferisphaera sp. WC338 TaxID=3425129 RepID=UPI003D814FE3
MNDQQNPDKKPNSQNASHHHPQNIHHTPTIPIWQRRWFQVAIGILVLITVMIIILPPIFSLLNLVSGVLIPLAIAFTLAYIVNPLVTLLQRRANIPRPFSACALLSLVAIALLALIVYVVPPLFAQSARLITNAPAYYKTLQEKIDETSANYSIDLRQSFLSFLASDEEEPNATGTTDNQAANNANQTESITPLPTPTESQSTSTDTTPQASDTTEENSSKPALSTDLLSTIYAAFTKFLSTSFGAIASTLGFASYLALSLGIIIFAFFFFVWRFQDMIEWFIPFIPQSYKDDTLDMIKKMDASIAAFIRGRLIQMSIITVVLAIGWSICGVPFWLLLAILGGLLNLIPYAPVLIWPTVILTTYLTALSGDAPQLLTDAGHLNYLAVFLWPSLVYFLAQGLDGWVVEPLVQGKATNLDPLTVMIVVLLGAAILGILGMLIAIPVAACIKILSSEFLLPKLRSLAKHN